jgi:hypothetical protein
MIFYIKSSTDQFYAITHNCQSNHWIVLEFHEESHVILFYLGLKFQFNRISEKAF